jgi:PKD repeat protein
MAAGTQKRLTVLVDGSMDMALTKAYEHAGAALDANLKQFETLTSVYTPRVIGFALVDMGGVWGREPRFVTHVIYDRTASPAVAKLNPPSRVAGRDAFRQSVIDDAVFHKRFIEFLQLEVQSSAVVVVVSDTAMVSTLQSQVKVPAGVKLYTVQSPRKAGPPPAVVDRGALDLKITKLFREILEDSLTPAAEMVWSVEPMAVLASGQLRFEQAKAAQFTVTSGKPDIVWDVRAAAGDEAFVKDAYITYEGRRVAAPLTSGLYGLHIDFAKAPPSAGICVEVGAQARGASKILTSAGNNKIRLCTVDKSPVPIPIPTSVDFSWVPDYPRVGEPVTFVNSTQNATGDTRYTWSFGDGGESADKTDVTHAYAKRGSMKVVLQAENRAGKVSGEKGVLIRSALPQVSFRRKPDTETVKTGQVVDFVPLATNAVLCKWNFGDEPNDTPGRHDESVRHVFEKAGSYFVTIKAYNEEGETAQASAKVLVDDDDVVDFSVEAAAEGGEARLSGTAFFVGVPVRFKNTSKYRDGRQFVWTWGDGTPETNESAQVLLHAYAQEGSHTVRLTVTDKGSGERKVSHEVCVFALPTWSMPDEVGPDAEVTVALGLPTGLNDPKAFGVMLGDGPQTVAFDDRGEALVRFAGEGSVRAILKRLDSGFALQQKVVAIRSSTGLPAPLDVVLSLEFAVGDLACQNESPKIMVGQEFTVAGMAKTKAGGKTAEVTDVSVDFGDGTPAQRARVGVAVPHTYESDGVYTVTVTALAKGRSVAAKRVDLMVAKKGGLVPFLLLLALLLVGGVGWVICWLRRPPFVIQTVSKGNTTEPRKLSLLTWGVKLDELVYSDMRLKAEKDEDIWKIKVRAPVDVTLDNCLDRAVISAKGNQWSLPFGEGEYLVRQTGEKIVVKKNEGA